MNTAPATGKLLISDPFLKDPNFLRTVVFLCEHQDSGSFGFVLNRALGTTLQDYFPSLDGITLPVHYGGPVQPDSLHFLHTVPELIPDGQAVTDELWWGGDFETVKNLLLTDRLSSRQIKFFIGYSGWSGGQLEEEMSMNSWLVTDAPKTLVFNPKNAEIWKAAVLLLEPKYHEIINYPLDPQLN